MSKVVSPYGLAHAAAAPAVYGGYAGYGHGGYAGYAGYGHGLGKVTFILPMQQPNGNVLIILLIFNFL